MMELKNMETGYEKLDDKQLLQELGRKLAQISHARNVGNRFMLQTYEGHRRNILRELEDRGMIEDAKEKEICG